MSDNKTKDEIKDQWKERELGALWRVDGNNQSFYSGEITEKDGTKRKIVCFKNKFKEEGSNQPDIRIYESKEPEDA